MMFNHHLHHWLFPTYFHFFILPPISLTFASFPSKELSMGMSVKGKAFGVYRFFFFQLAAAHFEFWEMQGISSAPRIISPLGKSHGMVFNLALSCSDFPNLSYFFLFLPYSLHFPPKNSFLVIDPVQPCPCEIGGREWDDRPRAAVRNEIHGLSPAARIRQDYDQRTTQVKL